VIRIAVLLPCYNEGPAIGAVVRTFRLVLPQSEIYVYDNNSTDDTIANARAAGAIVRSEPMQGKGNVVRRMFADVEADVYVMADGDGTYDASAASGMMELLLRDNLDMVVGKRDGGTERNSYRPGHRFGNWLITRTVASLFDNRFHDVLSGYRVMSRRFVKSFPALVSGFEIETTLTIHALELGIPSAEVVTRYSERTQGTQSKLSTIWDGLRIFGVIALLFKEARPFRFFGILAGMFVATSLAVGIPIIVEFMDTGLVPRFPTAILATGMMLLGAIALTCGLILDSVSRGRLEAKRLLYQSSPAMQVVLASSSATPERRPHTSQQH
jgi:glycosyltransferase involved in cell wall biosynthesis